VIRLWLVGTVLALIYGSTLLVWPAGRVALVMHGPAR
jgi:hypothetical protein